MRKCKAGRPTKDIILLNKITKQKEEGLDSLVKAYPQAVKFIVELLNSDTAKDSTKLSAAKMIKELVEDQLNILLEEQESEKEDEDDEEEINLGKPNLFSSPKLTLIN